MRTKIKTQRVLSIRLTPAQLLSAFDFCEISALPCENMSTAVVLFLQSQIERLQAAEFIPTYLPEEAEALLADRVVAVGKLVTQRKITGQQQIASVERARGALHRQLSVSKTPLLGGDEFFQLPISAANPRSEAFDQGLFGANFGELSEERFKNSTDSYEEQSGVALFADFDSLFEGVLQEEEQKESQALLDLISIGVTDNSTQHTFATPERVNEVPETDPYLKVDKLYLSTQDDLTKKAIRIVYNNLSKEQWSSELAEKLTDQVLRSLL